MIVLYDVLQIFVAIFARRMASVKDMEKQILLMEKRIEILEKEVKHGRD
jgi:hypothetical protein